MLAGCRRVVDDVTTQGMTSPLGSVAANRHGQGGSAGTSACLGAADTGRGKAKRYRAVRRGQGVLTKGAVRGNARRRIVPVRERICRRVVRDRMSGAHR